MDISTKITLIVATVILIFLWHWMYNYFGILFLPACLPSGLPAMIVYEGYKEWIEEYRREKKFREEKSLQ